MRRMYSEKQIGDVAVKQLENKDLKVKTLEQSEPNYEQELNINTSPSGFTIEKSYCKFVQIGNFLYLILNGKIANPTESAISLNSINIAWDSILPDNIASKIYDIDGYPLSNPRGSEITSLIATGPAYISNKIASVLPDYRPNWVLDLYRPATSTTGRIAASLRRIKSADTSPSIPAGATWSFTARIELLLI